MRLLLTKLAGLIVATSVFCLPELVLAGTIGEFEASADVGKVEKPGSATYDADAKAYRVTGAGENIWKNTDAFQFVYRKVEGPAAAELVLTAEVKFVGEGKVAHRKGGWMIRQSLDADAPYVDVMTHGDGSIGMQFRKEKGGITDAVKSTVTAPAIVRLERHGDTFTLAVAGKDGVFQPGGSVTVKLTGTVYVGLGVCSHNAAATETAIFTNVSSNADAAK